MLVYDSNLDRLEFKDELGGNNNTIHYLFEFRQTGI